MKFLVAADDTGAIKEVSAARGTDTSKKDAVQPKSIKNFCNEGQSRRSKIIHLEAFNSKYLIASRQNGIVSIYELSDFDAADEDKYKLLYTYNLVTKDRPVALITLEHLDSFIVAYESGKTFVIRVSDKFDLEPVSVQLPKSSTIEILSRNPYDEGVYAYGGRENDVQIIRLYEKDVTKKTFFKKNSFEQPEVLFDAENVENDHLDMRVPVWINKLLFQEAKEGYKFVTATKYGQLRLYDTGESKSPLHDFKVCEKAIISMTFANKEQTEVVITDTHSLIAKHSLTQIDAKGFKIHSASAGWVVHPLAKLLGKYSQGGNTGATHALETEDEVLAAAGLDRYLRVFDTAKRNIVAKVYLGVEISSVVILDTEDEVEEIEGDDKPALKRKRRRDIQQAEESDDEEIWKQLDETKDAAVSKKKRKD